MDVVDFIFGCSTKPAGSKRVKANLSTNSSNGTPYCRPMEIAMAKQFSMLRMVAPSFAMSIKISPNVPSLYSPVRRKMACPLILAFCVKPRRFAGNERRSTILASLRFNLVSGEDCTLFCTSSSNSSIVSFPRSTMWDSDWDSTPCLPAGRFRISNLSFSEVTAFSSDFSREIFADFFLSLLLLKGCESFEPSR